MIKNVPQVLIIAGEASGDLHAAKLINDILQINPNIKFFGIGGEKMRQAGANILINSNQLAVMGLGFFSRLPQIFSAFKLIRSILYKQPPNLLILVDYPGFNLHVAKLAKKNDIRVLYYISPKIWASRQYRVKTIRKYVDKVAVIFPFEVEFYKKFNIPVTFVGNPLSLSAVPTQTKQETYEKIQIEPNNKIIGLFPGSRRSEIKRLLPVMLKTAQLLQNKFPNSQFLLPLASSLTKNDLLPYLKDNSINLKIIEDNVLNKISIYDVINICDAIIAASGTVTLEIALINIPMVIIYKIFPSYLPIKKIINIEHIGLCNIIADKEIVKELLQQHANPKEIYAEMIRILLDDSYRNKMRHELKLVKDYLTNKEAENLAELALNMMR